MNIYARITRNLGLASVVGILALDQAFAGTYENLEYGYQDVYSGPFSPPTTYFYISGYTGSPVDLIVPGVIQDDVYGEITILNLNSNSYPLNNTDGIANGAFEDCTSLKSIVLPEGLDSIGGGAFKGCTNLITITLPSSLVRIGQGEYGEYGEYGVFEGCTSLKSINLSDGISSITRASFKGCTSLTSITLPSSLNTLGSNAFEGCTSLKSISLPDGISYISSATFKGCTSLNSIVLPEGLDSIGDGAFKGCTNLASITLPSSLNSIEARAFEGCTSLAQITLPDELEYIPYEAFKGCTSLASIALPESLNFIDSNAFEGCTSLTQITLPAETNTIGWETFQGCDNLATITLGADFEGIGYSEGYGVDGSEALAEEFNELPKLTNINVSASNEDFESVDGVLYSKDKSELIAFPAGRTGNFVIPGHVKIIGESAFSNSKLTSITISDTVTHIDEYAFEGASQLQSISIPDKFATELGVMRLPSSLAFETLVKAITNKIASGTNNYGLSIKSDLNSYTTKTDAANYASKSDLNSYTTKTDAANYASKSDVSSFALKNELPQAVEKVLADIDASLGPAPVITSDLATMNLRTGKAMTYRTTTNFNATAFSAVGLPTGLNINPVTGVISGKPSKKGTFSAFIYAGIPGEATTTSVKMFIVK
jgi:hypothetical protein